MTLKSVEETKTFHMSEVSGWNFDQQFTWISAKHLIGVDQSGTKLVYPSPNAPFAHPLNSSYFIQVLL